jgi:hypothetical protein
MGTTHTLDVATMDPRAAALILAAHAECDFLTAERAIREGPDRIRTRALRRRLRREMVALGIPGAQR